MSLMRYKVEGCKDCPMRCTALEHGEAQEEYCDHPMFRNGAATVTLDSENYLEDKKRPEWCPLLSHALILES